MLPGGQPDDLTTTELQQLTGDGHAEDVAKDNDEKKIWRLSHEPQHSYEPPVVLLVMETIVVAWRL